VINFLFKITYF